MPCKTGTPRVNSSHSLASDLAKLPSALYLRALNQVRDFRWRHWCFTREYILKKTTHPTATGGSPIVLVSLLKESHLDQY
jgi:hypothetical protein